MCRDIQIWRDIQGHTGICRDIMVLHVRGLVSKGFRCRSSFQGFCFFGLRLACFGLRIGCRVRRGKHSRYKPAGVGHRLWFSKGKKFFAEIRMEQVGKIATPSRCV